MKQESILCVPHGALLSEIRTTRGFIPFDPSGRGPVPLDTEDIKRIFSPGNLWFVPRPHAEEDDSFKQVIPYLVVTSGEKILLYRRTPKGGEARLHNRYSIGAGGHVSVADALVGSEEALDFTSTIALATTRELQEELGISYRSINDIEPAGLIYDDRDAVGRVHLGYVQMIRVKSQAIGVVEDHLEHVRFTAVDALADYYENMESWSQFVTDFISKNKETFL